MAVLQCTPGAPRRGARRVSPLTSTPFTHRRTTPLARRLKSRRRPGNLVIPHAAVTNVNDSSTTQPTSPLNLYVGENFSVGLHRIFKFQSLVQDDAAGGVIKSEFDPFKKPGSMSLSAEAQKLRDVPNAGGNSVMSEVLSYELMGKCFGARLLKTEMEVTYWPEGGSITDYTCSLLNTTVGVSVTRAMKYRGPFTTEDAERLLTKKLNGILQSTQNTLEKWSKQVLHVWATSNHVADVIAKTYLNIPARIKSNTVVMITVASRANDIFYNKIEKIR